MVQKTTYHEDKFLKDFYVSIKDSDTPCQAFRLPIEYTETGFLKLNPNGQYKKHELKKKQECLQSLTSPCLVHYFLFTSHLLPPLRVPSLVLVSRKSISHAWSFRD